MGPVSFVKDHRHRSQLQTGLGDVLPAKSPGWSALPSRGFRAKDCVNPQVITCRNASPPPPPS